MNIHYLKDIKADKSVNTISLRIDFFAHLTPEFETNFLAQLDAELEKEDVFVHWAMGNDFVMGYFSEFGEAVAFSKIDLIIRNIYAEYLAQIKAVTFNKKAFLTKSYYFWTHFEGKMRVLETPFKHIFPNLLVSYQMENAVEYLQGTSMEEDFLLQITRKKTANHNLLISVGTILLTETQIAGLAYKFKEVLRSKISFGKILPSHSSETPYYKVIKVY